MTMALQVPTSFRMRLVVAFVALITRSRTVAFVACSFELLGVLIVGTFSYTNPHDFPELDDSDWHYEDGMLTGIQGVRTALRARANERGDS